jgi:serine/threonine protein phosphatase PrpC
MFPCSMSEIHRCYRLRGNTLEQLSNDHTVIQELLDQGAISLAEAAEHPQRSMLTQAAAR